MSAQTREYDLVVIGGGPAGVIGATAATAFGKTVALVDCHHELGGTGVNLGTVPSKTLRETALALSGFRARRLTGLDVFVRREATVGEFLKHEQQVKAGLSAMLSQRLDAFKADINVGWGSFVDPHTVCVRAAELQGQESQPADIDDGVLLRGQRILIATGSKPFRPPVFPFGRPEVYDSDTILELDRLPKTLAVVGAGVIGSEYACTFAALGTQVHLIDRHEVLLPFLDTEVSQALVKAMEHGGVNFHWKVQVQACITQARDSAPGEAAGVTLMLSPGTPLTADAVLVAAGRTSNSEGLNLAAAGVKVGERGLIPVDDYFRTSASHIYAAGDVIGFPALASTSMEQARRAVLHALDLGIHSEFPRVLPTGIYTIPEVGMVGETEQSLREQGMDYVVGRAPYEASARGRIIGDTEGFLKLLFRRVDMKLLGVHVMGELATEIVHIGMMAMLGGHTVDAFENVCFNIPTLGVLYKVAAFDAAIHASKEAVVHSLEVSG